MERCDSRRYTGIPGVRSVDGDKPTTTTAVILESFIISPSQSGSPAIAS